MRLGDWLELKGVKPRQFARMIGVNSSNVSRMVAGERTPSLKTAVKIYLITGCSVGLLDWFSEEEVKEIMSGAESFADQGAA